MNLISSLWIAAGICAIILAADGILTRFLPQTRSAAFARRRLLPFSALMIVLGVGCIILGIYEATA